jgi:hypothetical protein
MSRDADPATVPDPPTKGVTEPPVAAPRASEPLPTEIGGPEGPEPTRYGDWERKGRCIDF